MSPAKKRTAAGGKGAELASFAVEQAKKVLQDEKLQQMLIERGMAIATQAQQWRKDRRFAVSGSGKRRSLGEHFGQRKLEARVANLGVSLASLGDGRPELAEALAPVSDAVAQIGLSVEIAGRLPVVKRKRAHLRVDRELDRLEESIFEAAFPSEEGTS